MRLRDHLRADLVLSDLNAPDRDSTLERMADFLSEKVPTLGRAEVLSALRAREEAHSTAMGHGMALPHATLSGLEKTVLGVALAPEPIAFGGDDDDPVRLFFVLLSPPGSEGTHIKLLARICRLVRSAGVADELLEATSGDAVVAAILRHDEAHV